MLGNLPAEIVFLVAGKHLGQNVPFVSERKVRDICWEDVPGRLTVMRAHTSLSRDAIGHYEKSTKRTPPPGDCLPRW